MREVFVVLPSQGMDSFSLAGSSEDCHELLAAWSCAYHPEVLRLTRKTANPLYGLYIYEEPENAILITPKPTLDILDSYWMERAENRNCTFLKNCADLETLTADLIHCLHEDAKKDAENAEKSAETKEVEETEKSEGDTETIEDAESTETTKTKEIAETKESAEATKNTENIKTIDFTTISDSKMPEVMDFMALGMMHLLSEIMAHKLQFMSYLDSFSFTRDVLSILDAMESGDSEKAKREMQSAWDQLVQSRQYYAPQDGFLFDYTLLDISYLPEAFEQEAESAQAMNVLADGAVLAQMRDEFPAMFEALKKGVDAKKICLAGGEETETELPLLTQEGIVRRLKHGIQVYEQIFGRRPLIYARRKYGLTPLLPNILKRLGFIGALHFTLDDGKFPVTEQSRIAWKGMDGQVIESISKIPLDAQQANAISGVPVRLAQSLNIDNAFGAVFAHWSGEEMTNFWYKLLKRSCRWIPLFGNLTTFSECFESTRFSSTEEQFSPERYHSPYLAQMVEKAEADPISRWSRYHQLRSRLEGLGSLESLAIWLQGTTSSGTNSSGTNSASGSQSVSERLLNRIDSVSQVTKDLFSSAWQEVLSAERKVSEQISAALSDGPRKNALLLLNPSSFSRSRTTDLSEAEKLLSVSRLIPEVKDCVKNHFWETHAEGSRTAVHAAKIEVPPLGFSVLADSPSQPATPAETKPAKRGWFFGSGKKAAPLPPPVYQDQESGMWLMTNEHLTLRFDPYTGHLRSVFDNIHRGNRFSQQLAIRLKAAALDSLAEESPDEYTIMAADTFKPAIFADRSELEVSGRLMDRKGEIVARFSQTTTLRRGSSIVEFDVFLEPLRDFGKNPWQSYCASRLAWGASTVDFFQNIGFTVRQTTASKLEAPYFVNIRPLHFTATTRIVSSVTHELAQRVRGHELRSEDFLPERGNEIEYSDSTLTLLANGLPWHRNCGSRRLDTLLLVRGETCRRFRFGVAVSTPLPMQTAQSFMTPIYQTPLALSGKGTEKQILSSWLGHVSHRNVIVTHWEAEAEGAKIRFAETEGRKVRVTFQAFRPIENAEQTDFFGERLNTLVIEQDQVRFEMFPNEFKEIRITFRK